MAGAELDLGKLLVHLGLDYTDFESSVEYAKDSLSGITAEFAPIQAQINKQFTALPTGFTTQIEKQFAVQARLQDEYFEATSSRRDIDLRNAGRYYDDLRMQFQGNQEMLTSIDRTETAKRTQLLQNYGATAQSIMRPLGFLIRGGIYAYFISAAIDATTAMIKASKESGTTKEKFGIMLNTFAESIPVLNRFTKSITDLRMEISGLNAVMASAAALVKSMEPVTKTTRDIFTTLRLMMVSPENREQEQITIDYKQQLKDLTKARYEEIKAIKEHNTQIQKQIDLAQEKTIPIPGAWAPPALSQEKAEEEIKELQSQILGVPSPGAGAAEMALKEIYDIRLLEKQQAPVKEMEKQLTRMVDTYKMNAFEIARYDANTRGTIETDSVFIDIQEKKYDLLEQNSKATEESLRLLDEYKKEMQSFTETVKKSLKTPFENIEEVSKKIQAAMKDYGLSAQQGADYLAKATQDILTKAQPKLYSFIETVKEMIKTPAEEFSEINKMLDEAVKVEGGLTEKQADIARILYRAQIYSALKGGAGGGSTREINPLYMSVSGLATGGMNNLLTVSQQQLMETQKQTDTLEAIKTNTAKYEPLE